ncbi:hypothetical protein SLS62_005617 [Diatrype stigma]|uniref:Uncharacterized protein n=1 Tax=Diatrype stigma TaxID=117547 RepID=A0AAN9YSE6_9PEZI
MSKKNKNKKGHNGQQGGVALQPQSEPKKPKIVQQWEEYFREGNLEDWQRLMRHLGFEGEFDSKKKCRKALKRKVWVNITDFLAAVRAGNTPYLERFPDEQALAEYTKRTRKVYPREMVEKGSPLKLLLALIFSPRYR